MGPADVLDVALFGGEAPLAPRAGEVRVGADPVSEEEEERVGSILKS